MSGTAIVTAHQGEPLDALIWRARGLGPGALPAVFDLNPGIAASALLPEGQAVTIPAISAAPPILETINLWD